MLNIHKIILLFLCVFLLSGCAKNVDLRKQAREEKVSISSMQNTADSIEEEKADSTKKIPNETSKVLNEPVKILFVGDMMLDRHIREAVGKYGGGDYDYVLQPLKEKLAEFDLVVGNLEGPITENESTSVNTKIGESKNFVFTFDPAVAKVLFDNNIKLVNIGNNHILNQGEKGIEQTKRYLDEVGVNYFDESSTFFGDQSPTLVIDKSRTLIRIGFVSYNYSVPNSADAAVEEIRSAKEKSDVVIVCPHWGTEYKVGDPGEAVRALAHRFIDAGADLIVGTHPHVVQNSEEYYGKKIYYSLGNFIFDQYFQKETMEGLGAEVTINPDRTMEFGELKFEMTKRGQTIVNSIR